MVNSRGWKRQRLLKSLVPLSHKSDEKQHEHEAMDQAQKNYSTYDQKPEVSNFLTILKKVDDIKV
jgi:hypothetical protein